MFSLLGLLPFLFRLCSFVLEQTLIWTVTLPLSSFMQYKSLKHKVYVYMNIIHINVHYYYYYYYVFKQESWLMQRGTLWLFFREMKGRVHVIRLFKHVVLSRECPRCPPSLQWVVWGALRRARGVECEVGVGWRRALGCRREDGWMALQPLLLVWWGFVMCGQLICSLSWPVLICPSLNTPYTPAPHPTLLNQKKKKKKIQASGHKGVLLPQKDLLNFVVALVK